MFENLLVWFPIWRDYFLKYIIVIYEKVGDSYAVKYDYGKKIMKNGMPFMQFVTTKFVEAFPEPEAIRINFANSPIRWFGGKLVHCTLVGKKITWVNPTIDFTVYNSLDSGEQQLAVRHITEGVTKYEVTKDKQPTLVQIMPYIILLVTCGFALYLMAQGSAILQGMPGQVYQAAVTGLKDGFIEIGGIETLLP